MDWFNFFSKRMTAACIEYSKWIFSGFFSLSFSSNQNISRFDTRVISCPFLLVFGCFFHSFFETASVTAAVWISIFFLAGIVTLTPFLNNFLIILISKKPRSSIKSSPGFKYSDFKIISLLIFKSWGFAVFITISSINPELGPKPLKTPSLYPLNFSPPLYVIVLPS